VILSAIIWRKKATGPKWAKKYTVHWLYEEGTNSITSIHVYALEVISAVRGVLFEAQFM
jgi:hypothetical protein